MAARHPGVARLRALVSDGDRDEGGGVGGAARLACTPAVTVGAPGELRPVAALGNGERATGLFWWPPGRPGVAGERRAVRALASERGVRAVPVGRGGAFAVTADGATLRALVARAPGVSAQLAVAGTRELCLLD